MRPDGYPPEAWERLGRLLEERRGELNPEWANRAQFLRDTGMNKKLVERLELAKPGQYRPATLAKVSVAYGWTGDSIRRILAGGQPQPRADAVPAPQPLIAQDAYEAAVLASSLTDAEKSEAIGAHRERMARELAELGVTEIPPFIRRGVMRLAAEQDGEDGSASRQAGRPA